MGKQPEAIFQSWNDRFLDAVVLPPCHTMGIDHPAQKSASNVAFQQRLRARGIKPGTADVYVCQAPSRSLWLELKWGKNKTSDAQDAFANAIWKCGIGYEVCYSIHDVLAALTRAGFRLHGNAANLATEYQARVEASIEAAKEPHKRAANPFKPKPPTEKARKAWQTYAKLLPVALFALLSTAHAAPPPGADPDSPTAQWFHSLRMPDTGYLCCSLADCRPVVHRVVGDHYQAFIDRKTFGKTAPDTWVDVPPARVLHKHDNPLGEAVACYFMGEIRCFVESAGT